MSVYKYKDLAVWDIQRGGGLMRIIGYNTVIMDSAREGENTQEGGTRSRKVSGRVW